MFSKIYDTHYKQSVEDHQQELYAIHPAPLHFRKTIPEKTLPKIKQKTSITQTKIPEKCVRLK